jgi:ribosomal protein S18 acetylase RimI-like enzyme/L-amino acid N-acyltransferase YncA
VAKNSEIKEMLEKMVIRPIKEQDFDQLFKLVNSSFRREIDITGLDLQRLSRVAKLYRIVEMLLSVFDVFHRDFETILVAVSGDRLIGEMHLVPHGKKIWSIDSTAVDAAFRRRGVYTKLFKESLKYISGRNGERVITSLRADNIAPVIMTKRLGLEIFERELFLQFEACGIPNVKLDENVSIRELSSADAERVFEICRLLSPRKMKVYKITPEDFVDSLFTRIMRRFTWSCSKKLILEMRGKIVGYAYVTYVPSQQAGRIESFYVLPSDRSSELTSIFLRKTLEFLETKNVKKVTTNLNEEWKETICIFEGFGFKPIALVYEMMKEPV